MSRANKRTIIVDADQGAHRNTTGITRSLPVVALSTAVLVALPIQSAQAAPPANDDLEDATPVDISELPYMDMVDTTEATTEADDPDCYDSGRTVWYTLTTGPTDVIVYANTFGSDYDTTISAYSYPPGPDTQLACNDDAAETLQSEIIFDAGPFETYYIMVGAYDDSPGGNLELSVDYTLPPLPEIDVTFDPKGDFDPQTGEATISGTMYCSIPAEGYVYVILEQTVLGHLTLQGSSSTSVYCNGETDFNISVESADGNYKGGPANIEYVEAVGCYQYGSGNLCGYDFNDDIPLILTGGGN